MTKVYNLKSGYQSNAQLVRSNQMADLTYRGQQWHILVKLNLLV